MVVRGAFLKSVTAASCELVSCNSPHSFMPATYGKTTHRLLQFDLTQSRLYCEVFYWN